jgi:hypothetical protein
MNITPLAAKSLHDFFRPFEKRLSRPDLKKCFSLLKGMIQGKTVQLSQIGRTVQAEILPKTYGEKVGKSLERFGKLAQVQLGKGRNMKLELLIYDSGDQQKPSAKQIKGVIPLRDGSTGNLYGQGYGLHGLVGKSNQDEYVPLLLERYEEQNFSLLAMIQNTINELGPDHGATWVMDRGGDDKKIFNFLLDREQEFLIRLDYGGSERLLQVEEEQHRVSVLTGHMKEAGYRRVKLPGRPEVLTLIYFHRRRYRQPLALLTTLSPKTENQAVGIAKLYLKRWKIEDYYRFIKTRLDLENMMVQKLERVDGLLAVVLMASAFLMKLEQRTRDIVLDWYYQRWLKKNQVHSSWSALTRFMQEIFEKWRLTFRTAQSPPNSLQLALFLD